MSGLFIQNRQKFAVGKRLVWSAYVWETKLKTTTTKKRVIYVLLVKG